MIVSVTEISAIVKLACLLIPSYESAVYMFDHNVVRRLPKLFRKFQATAVTLFDFGKQFDPFVHIRRIARMPTFLRCLPRHIRGTESIMWIGSCWLSMWKRLMTDFGLGVATAGCWRVVEVDEKCCCCSWKWLAPYRNWFEGPGSDKWCAGSLIFTVPTYCKSCMSAKWWGLLACTRNGCGE